MYYNKIPNNKGRGRRGRIPTLGFPTNSCSLRNKL